VRGAWPSWSAWMAWRATSPPFCGCSVTLCVYRASRAVAACHGPQLAYRPGHQALCPAAGGPGRAPRGVRGTATALALVLKATGGTVIHTASIERLNATFRSALAPRVRRGHALVHKEAVMTAGMYSLGCAYHLCWYHDSLRLAAPENVPRKWQERTPAMAAGLTDHCWTLRELLLLKVPLPAWVAPKRRGRPPKLKLQPTTAMAA
jgi:hypothetical protein